MVSAGGLQATARLSGASGQYGPAALCAAHSKAGVRRRCDAPGMLAGVDRTPARWIAEFGQNPRGGASNATQAGTSAPWRFTAGTSIREKAPDCSACRGRSDAQGRTRTLGATLCPTAGRGLGERLTGLPRRQTTLQRGLVHQGPRHQFRQRVGHWLSSQNRHHLLGDGHGQLVVTA